MFRWIVAFTLLAMLVGCTPRQKIVRMEAELALLKGGPHIATTQPGLRRPVRYRLHQRG